MVPELAVNAIKIKCGFPTAKMTGNYECAYALGIFSYQLKEPEREKIDNMIQYKNELSEKLKMYEAPNDKMKRLMEILLDYEPGEIVDSQTDELYHWGYRDKIIT